MRGTGAVWRSARADDLRSMLAIQDVVHRLLPEREAVFADKLAACPEGCRVLVDDGTCLGYGIAHPWMLDDIPPLDALLPGLPATPDCVYLHDVALLPAARGRGAGGAFVRHAEALAERRGCAALALISVYDSFPIWSACGFALRVVPSLARKLETYGASARYMAAVLPRAAPASRPEV